MGFSGIRAVIMLVFLGILVLAIAKLDLPGWILPVGLIVAGIAMNVKVPRASA
jgi:hypothetical protein